MSTICFKNEVPMCMARAGLTAMLACVTAITAGGCCIRRVAVPASLPHAARSYRENRDLGSLQELISGLRLGMPERDVVALLGDPTYCPVDGQCYYPSDKKDQNGFTLTLVVEYRYNLHTGNDTTTVLTHRLESYSLFGVGE